MNGKKEIHLDFEVDELTNSIENAVSGEVFKTVITKLEMEKISKLRRQNGHLIGKQNLKTNQNRFLN